MLSIVKSSPNFSNKAKKNNNENPPKLRKLNPNNASLTNYDPYIENEEREIKRLGKLLKIDPLKKQRAADKLNKEFSMFEVII